MATTAVDRRFVEPLRGRYPQVTWIEAPRGRALQMNAGAANARGEWLLFLHADTILPAAWIDAVVAADADPSVAIGCFRFALDSRAVAARALERGVAIRVHLFKLPYGDQAIFIRRSVFMAIGGYADIPIMEDVDLVRRARRCGRLTVSALPAVTSARRWQQQGWAGTTAVNLGLILLYLVGVPPAALIRIDRGRHL